MTIRDGPQPTLGNGWRPNRAYCQMAEQPEKPVNAGEEVTNPPSSLPLKPEDQFRLINQKLADFSDKLSRVAEPPQFRLADMIQLGVIVIGFIIAIFTAFNLS